MVKLAAFDTARYLDNPQVISAYLAEAMQSHDPKLILRALRNVVRAGHVSQIARATGLSRTSLYWREKASPEFTTVLKVLGVLGVELEPVARDDRRSKRHPSHKSTPPSRRVKQKSGHVH
jgi:probable addiction module antidote protein